MLDYRDEVGSSLHLTEGDEVTIEGLDLTYREEPKKGYFYRLESEEIEFKVLSRTKSPSDGLHIIIGDWRKMGLSNYLKKLEESELLSPGEGDYPPQPSFKSPEVEEELKSLAEKFLEK